MTDFLELLEPQDLRWPRRGDRLLRPSLSWFDGARFADHQVPRQSWIWDGYMKAASLLVDHCKDHDTDRFGLVYPILFNYRHGLEVAIKWTLDQYGSYAGIKEYKRSHNLKELWRLCRGTIVHISGKADDPALKVVSRVIVEFHVTDKTSFSFRYATSHNGRLVPLPSISVDLENLQDVMEGVNNFFIGVDGELDRITSAIPSDV